MVGVVFYGDVCDGFLVSGFGSIFVSVINVFWSVLVSGS
jgi:hypothetical protein